MNDKELDDFFRKQSENPDIPYREEDWGKLREKLDVSPPPRSINGSKQGYEGWWIGLLVLALITGAGLGWTLLRDNVQNPEAKSEQSVTARVLNSDSTTSADDFQETDKTDHLTAEDPHGGIISISTPNPIAIPIADGTELEGLIDKRTSTTSKSAGFGPSSNKMVVAKPLKPSQIIPIKVNPYNIQHLSPDIVTNVQEDQIQGSLLKATRKQIPISKPALNTGRIEGSRFYTTLTFAPDVSALKIKDIRGLGNSVGLNVEYFFHPKISINIGALYSFKTYQAGDGYSTGYMPAPSQVSGDCWVLDLPLNVRYYAFNQELSRWYVTTGLSSYLMLKEKYDLEYTSSNYGGSAYGNSLEVQNKNQHYLNIVNLGVGYERVLTNKLSLQVEPYLKLPFRGIGEGDITLKSAGAFVGLKYGW